MILDIKRLIIINDLEGHAFGDKLIIKISIIIKELCSNIDYIFRYGGDEFVILIPHKEESQVKEMAEKILEKVRKLSTAQYGVALSIGISNTNEKTKNLTELLERADIAIYTASNKATMSNGIIEWAF